MSDSAPITAICPGSYDPVTNGHLDIITRAAGIFERVVVGVVRDPQHKKAMFPVEERVQFLRDALADCDNVEVKCEIQSSIPKHKTQIYKMVPKNDGSLFFHPDDPEDPEANHLYDAQAERDDQGKKLRDK